MLDAHRKSPVTRQRLRSGPTADYMDGFAAWLHQCGYWPATLDPALRSLASWTDWIRSAGFDVHDLLAGLDACAAALVEQQRVRYSRGPNRASLTAARLFIRFLREQGVLPPLAAARSPVDQWPVLGEFRAYARQHGGLTETSVDAYKRVLVRLLTALGDDPRAYTAEALRGFVLEQARPHRVAHAKRVVVAVRAFLRFLGATGGSPSSARDAARSGCRCRRRSAPRSSPTCAMAGRPCRRPRCSLPSWRRAGIKAPVNGAHVLRHRSPRTTAHYAKVDFGLLSEIAQP